MSLLKLWPWSVDIFGDQKYDKQLNRIVVVYGVKYSMDFFLES